MARRPLLRPASPTPRLMAQASASPVLQGEDAASQDAGHAVMVQAETDGLLRQFMDLLGDDPSLDDSDRSLIRQELANAMAAVEASGAGFEEPDRAAWMDAANALHAAGAVSDDEAHALVRQLDGALSALERKESRFAMEFSRRMARDGETAALEWLRQNRQVLLDDGDGAADAAMSNGFGGPQPAVATDAIRSRSRRVRGPPARGVR